MSLEERKSPAEGPRSVQRGRHGTGDGHGKLNVKIHLSVWKILRSNSLKAAKGVNRKQSPQRRAAELGGGGGGG